MKTSTRSALPVPLARLVHCCRVLGPWLGFRYWRLQNKAIRNPDLVPIWIEAWEYGATEAEKKGDVLLAYCLRGMIEECKRVLREYHAVNSVLTHRTATKESDGL